MYKVDDVGGVDRHRRPGLEEDRERRDGVGKETRPSHDTGGEGEELMFGGVRIRDEG